MTIDERLERLADRHEALSNTVELLTHDIDALRAEGKEIGDKIRALAIVAEQNEGRAAKMMDAITRQEARAGQMMDAITRQEARAGQMMDAITRQEARAGQMMDAITRQETGASQMMDAITRQEARAGQMMDAITRLARVADNHEGRLSDLES